MKTKFLFIVAVLILYSSFAMATIINVPDSCLTIQAAIDSASVGDTVLVQPDTYVENINFNGKNIVVSSLLLLYPDSLSYTDSTIINGNQNGSVVTFANGEDSTAILSGFTITNGSANYGGGIYCYNSSPSLMNLYITNNNSTNYGAGIHCYSSSNLSLYRVAIYENTTLGNGGGISCFDNSNPSLENVTISQNIAYQDGCGIACLFNSSVNIVNTIIWNNGAHEIYVSPSGSISATYSDIKDGTGQSYFGTGCIDANPLFANPNTGNYNLTAISPCIDAGNPNSPLDPDGTIVDMGAFYFQQTASGITGTVTLNGGTGNVEDVEVTADTITVNPNPDGSYIIYIDPGTYDVVASLIGYGPSTQTGVVVDSFLVTPGIDFTLNAISLGTIEGTVTLEGTGNVEDVQVTAGTTTVNPDTNGVYLITVEPGTYDVTASLSPTYQDSTIEDLIVGSGQQVIDQDFYLKLIVFEGIIEGNISLLGGAGNVENVEVTADTVTVNPNASGNYSISIIEGIYDVSASLDGYNSVTIPDVAVVAFDTTRNVDMTLLNWVVIPGTEFSMILYATATLDGQFVDNSASNQLAAFGPGGVSDCRGIGNWLEGNHPLWNGYWDLDGYWYFTIVSNNNSGTDTISFKLYDTDTDSIYNLSETLIFSDNSTTNIDFLITQYTRDQMFSLIENWNWISFNVHPNETSLDSVFESLGNKCIQVKNQTLSADYIDPPGQWVGGLTNITDGEGYLLKLNSAVDTFIINGYLLNPVINPINLVHNWNWIAYYPQTTLTLDEALVSILDSIKVVKNQTKSAVYNAGAWAGDLTQMQPGVCYKLQTDANSDTLTYPGATTTKSIPLFVETMDSYANSADWEIISGTQSNMIIMAELIINNKVINNNYIAGVFDKDGNCRSIGKWENGFWYFTVVGNIDGTELHLKVFDPEKEIIYESNEKITYQTDSIIGTPEKTIVITFDDSNIDIPQKYNLENNHPNPFKQSTIISYQLPEKTLVEIAIYNILGQKVNTLVYEEKDVGNHSEIWNGSDSNNYNLPNGIYFYKITTANYSEVKKLIKLK